MRVEGVPAEQIRTEAVKNETAQSSPREIPLPLKEGDVIKGEVLFASNGRIHLKLDSGALLKATVEEGVSVAVGRNAELVVAERTPARIVLRMADGGALNSGGSKLSPSVLLENMGLARTAENMRVAEFLQEARIPVTARVVETMARLLSADEQMTLPKAAFMAANRLSGDAVLIKALNTVLSGGPLVGAQLEELGALLLTAAGDAGVAAPKEAAARLLQWGNALSQAADSGTARMPSFSAQTPVISAASDTAQTLNGGQPARTVPQGGAQAAGGANAPLIAGDLSPLDLPPLLGRLFRTALASLPTGAAANPLSDSSANPTANPASASTPGATVSPQTAGTAVSVTAGTPAPAAGLSADNAADSGPLAPAVSQGINPAPQGADSQAVNARNPASVSTPGAAVSPQTAGTAVSVTAEMPAPAAAEVVSALNTVRQYSFTGTAERAVSLLSVMPEDAAGEILEQATRSLPAEVRGAVREAVTVLARAESAYGGRQNAVPASLAGLADEVRSLFHNLPEDTGGEAVKQAGRELPVRLSEIVRQLPVPERADSLAAAQNTIEQLAGQLRLMSEINQYAYVQLPVSIFNEKHTAELYVMKRNNKKKIDPEQVTMLVALDTQRLGRVESLIEVRQKNVSIQFSMDREESVDFIRAHTVDLFRRIAESGYKLADTRFKMIEEKADPLNVERKIEEWVSALRHQVDLQV